MHKNSVFNYPENPENPEGASSRGFNLMPIRDMYRMFSAFTSGLLGRQSHQQWLSNMKRKGRIPQNYRSTHQEPNSWLNRLINKK